MLPPATGVKVRSSGQAIALGIGGSLRTVKVSPGDRWAWLMLDSQGSRPDFRCGQGVKHENLLGQDLDRGRGWKYRRLCSVHPPPPPPPVAARSWNVIISSKNPPSTPTRPLILQISTEFSSSDQDGWKVDDILLKSKLAWLRALCNGRAVRIQHGKDSAHPQQESWYLEPTSSAGDCRIHCWVRRHINFLSFPNFI